MKRTQHQPFFYCTVLVVLLYNFNSWAMPANDDIGNAINITQLPATLSLAVDDATQASDEITPSCNDSATGSVWYRLTASETTALHINTFTSSYDTVLSVWSGSPNNLQALQELACNDDDNGTLQSRVKLDVQANRFYYINVSGIDTDSGTLQLQITPLAATTNDNIADAVRIIPQNASDFQHVQSVQNATIPFGEALSSCGENKALSKSVWFRYRTNDTQRVVFNTFGSSYDTVLALWTGTQRVLVEQACNDDGSNSQSALTFTVQSDTTYYLSVMAKTTGSLSNADNVLVFNVSMPVANDDLANAQAITQVPTAITANTDGAGLELQEQLPSCLPRVGRSVWFSLPANTVTGEITFTTSNINFDSVLSVWRGAEHPLTEVGCNDESAALDQSTEAQLTVDIQPDTTYYVNVAGIEDNSGQFTLSLQPAVRDFSIARSPQDSVVVTGQSANLTVVLQNLEGDVLENGADVSNQWETLVTVPFTYQWYNGASGDVSRPVAGNSYQLITPPLTATSEFWVRVRNATGSVDSATATVQVLPVPDAEIPQVTNGVGIDADGQPLSTQAHFNGVITTVAGAQGNPLAASQQDTLAIVSSIQVDPAHVGQQADIAMVAQYIAADSALFYQRRPDQNDAPVWDVWDGGLNSLVAVDTGVELRALHENIPIFIGQLQGLPGQFRVFIGYRLLDSGEVYYNGEAIELTIE